MVEKEMIDDKGLDPTIAALLAEAEEKPLAKVDLSVTSFTPIEKCYEGTTGTAEITVESTSATLGNATVETYSSDKNVKQDSADVTIESSNNDKTLTLKVAGSTIKSANEFVSFAVSAADTLTIKTTDGTGGKGSVMPVSFTSSSLT